MTVLALGLAGAITAQITKPKVYKGGKSTGSKSGGKTGVKSTTKRSTTAKGKSAAKSRRPLAKGKSKSKRAPARARGQLRPTSERYKQIEQALAAKGYLGEEPSGKWGPGSVEALRAFQSDHQLPPTGKLDALSLTQLGLGPRQ